MSTGSRFSETLLSRNILIALQPIRASFNVLAGWANAPQSLLQIYCFTIFKERLIVPSNQENNGLPTHSCSLKRGPATNRPVLVFCKQCVTAHTMLIPLVIKHTLKNCLLSHLWRMLISKYFSSFRRISFSTLLIYCFTKTHSMLTDTHAIDEVKGLASFSIINFLRLGTQV